MRARPTTHSNRITAHTESDPQLNNQDCGVFAVYGHPEAVKLTYLGLCALQHRGQNSAGICASDNRRLVCRKSRGLVKEVFLEPALGELVGTLAVGQTGRSTNGSPELNIQPFTFRLGNRRMAYLSYDGLRQSVGDTSGRFCYACFTGKYTTAFFSRAEEPPEQDPMAETELLALAVFGNQLKLVSINPDGEYEFLDEAHNLHKLLWVFSTETKALKAALEEFESLINDPRVKEADLQNFFERNPDFVINDDYKKAHPHVVLATENAEPLIPDFVLEPTDQDGLCDLLELKHPLAKVFVMKPRRKRFSAQVFEACAQLRDYSLFFDDPKNRQAIYRNYGLRAFRPRLFLIIGRRGSASPIELRKAELDTPHLHLQTYDAVLDRMKARIKAMKEGRRR